MTSRSDEGFTLIEMIVVLTILGLMLTLVMSAVKPVSPATHAHAAAQTIAGALRSAHAEALSENRSVSFSLDLVSRSYRMDSGPVQTLPNDLQVSLLTSRDQLVADGVGRIRFDPDGGSTGGRVTIAGGDRVWFVGVDWLSGRVSVEEKPR